jgi:hypothetical protein
MMNRFKIIFDIRKENKQKLFIVLLFFLGSFSVVHLFSLFIGGSIFFEGYQIHHFYFGTVALALGGLTGILSNHVKTLKIASSLIGIGLGLFADEIGLLLNCTSDNKVCTYFFSETNDIILALATFIIFLIMIVDSELPTPYRIYRKGKSKILDKIFN